MIYVESGVTHVIVEGGSRRSFEKIHKNKSGSGSPDNLNHNSYTAANQPEVRPQVVGESVAVTNS